ncbi:MAG: DUF3575 domain-containing protein [Bacteroidota bacterium]
MKKINFIAAICIGITTIANAETKLNVSSEKFLPNNSKPFTINKTNEGEKKLAHVVKLNASQLFLKNISLQYELGFHKNMSVALGYSNFLKREIPSQIYSNNKADGYQLPYMKGWAITPEFRFYPGKKEEKQAPHGFYLAPYMRYSKYTLGADYIQIDSTMTTRKYEFKGSYGGSTFGLMLGSQWIVGKHFAFDWWILGGGAGSGKLVFEVKSDDFDLTPAQQDALSNDITDNIGELGRFSNGAVSVDVNSNSAKVSVRGIPMVSLRGMLAGGFNFGYKF